jgi:Casein kinase II regulatory subunit
MLMLSSWTLQVCEFGRCPRVLCNGQPCLPVGTADVPRQSTVKIFCPKCKDIYYPRSKYQVCFPDDRCISTALSLCEHTYLDTAYIFYQVHASDTASI